jgi:hypothetical protein
VGATGNSRRLRERKAADIPLLGMPRPHVLNARPGDFETLEVSASAADIADRPPVANVDPGRRSSCSA